MRRAGRRATARHPPHRRTRGFPLDELGRITLAAKQDHRTVVTGDVLIAGKDAQLAPTHYQDWLRLR